MWKRGKNIGFEIKWTLVLPQAFSKYPAQYIVRLLFPATHTLSHSHSNHVIATSCQFFKYLLNFYLPFPFLLPSTTTNPKLQPESITPWSRALPSSFLLPHSHLPPACILLYPHPSGSHSIAPAIFLKYISDHVPLLLILNTGLQCTVR